MLKNHKVTASGKANFLPQEKQTQVWRQVKEVCKQSAFSGFKKQVTFFFLQILLVFVIMAYVKAGGQRMGVHTSTAMSTVPHVPHLHGVGGTWQ